MKRWSRGQLDKAAESEHAAAGDALQGDFDPPKGDGGKPSRGQYEPSTGNWRRANTARDTCPLWEQGCTAKNKIVSATRATEGRRGKASEVIRPRGYKVVTKEGKQAIASNVGAAFEFIKVGREGRGAVLAPNFSGSLLWPLLAAR